MLDQRSEEQCETVMKTKLEEECTIEYDEQCRTDVDYVCEEATVESSTYASSSPTTTYSSTTIENNNYDFGSSSSGDFVAQFATSDYESNSVSPPFAEIYESINDSPEPTNNGVIYSSSTPQPTVITTPSYSESSRDDAHLI